jgi:hypothetical protein
MSRTEYVFLTTRVDMFCATYTGFIETVEPFILTIFSKKLFLPHAVAEDFTELCSKVNSWF